MMTSELPSLHTPDLQAGLALASQLANRLHAEIGQNSVQTPWLGGMSYLAANSVSKEMIASILFYAIAAANQGWTGEA